MKRLEFLRALFGVTLLPFLPFCSDKDEGGISVDDIIRMREKLEQYRIPPKIIDGKEYYIFDTSTGRFLI